MSRQQQRARSEAMKHAILDAAIKIEMEEGSEKITVRKIGDMIGYSTGVIYYHFKDKQDIVRAIDEKLDEEAYNTVRSYIDFSLTERESIKKICISIYNLSKNSPDEYNRLFANRRIHSTGQNVWVDLIMEILQNSSDSGKVSADSLEFKANCILSYIVGCNMIFIEYGHQAVDIEKNADAIVDTILDGIYSVK